MSTEFITLDSKLTFKWNAISERKVKHAMATGSTATFAYGFVLIFIALCSYDLFVNKNYFQVPQLLLAALWLEPHIRKLYVNLFVKSWKGSVSLKEVHHVTTTPLENGLETQVILHLVGGRRKIYVFRNAENQLEGFLQLFDPAGETAMSLG